MKNVHCKHTKIEDRCKSTWNSETSQILFYFDSLTFAYTYANPSQLQLIIVLQVFLHCKKTCRTELQPPENRDLIEPQKDHSCTIGYYPN